MVQITDLYAGPTPQTIGGIFLSVPYPFYLVIELGDNQGQKLLIFHQSWLFLNS